MKRISAIVVLSIIFVMAFSSLAFAADSGLEIVNTTPKDGATGQAIDNMGVKVTFNKDVYSKDNQASNVKKCHLMEKKTGKKIKTRVAFSSKSKKLMLVVADTTKYAGKRAKNGGIKSLTEYELVIDDGFKAADGSTLDEYKMTFTTLNQSSSTKVSFAMMGVMVVAMIFMTMREAKKKLREEQEGGKTRQAGVNPYKEARRTGKSVEEIVARERKKKEKAAQKAKEEKEKAERLAEENKEEITSDNMRVPRPRPISEAGSGYKYVKPVQKSKSTNPKNQTGKSKNKGKKKKKK